MLIWINGTFGVGKTQTAHELKRRLPHSLIADPELLGFGIQRMYPQELRSDFQDSPWWAPVLAEILIDLSQKHHGHIIVPMALTNADRHEQIFAALREGGCDVRQVTLLADRSVVVRRLRSRFELKSGWAGARISSGTAALKDPRFAPHVDTSRMTVAAAADAIARLTDVELVPADSNRVRSALRRLGVQVRHIRVN